MMRDHLTVDKRATLHLRISINKKLGSKNSVNTQVAQLITDYSHASILKVGDIFADKTPHWFMYVTKLLSPFFCEVVKVRSKIVYVSLDHNPNIGRIVYQPVWSSVTVPFKKRIFEPFSTNPYLKDRHMKYHFLN